MAPGKEEVVLAINPGSTSRKYAVAVGGEIVLRAHFERVWEGLEVTWETPEGSDSHAFDSPDFATTTDAVLEECRQRGLLPPDGNFAKVGMRIVAPGPYFQKHQKVTPEFIKRLKAAAAEAPLHIRPELEEIEHVEKIMKQVPVYGISDSAFHATLPPVARTYAIAKEDSEKLELYRTGYHGLSVAAVVRKMGELGLKTDRAIVCHLGGGASITAVRDGKSADTSMGYTPLEGLVMATRVGDIDPGAVSHLVKAKKLDALGLEEYLNQQSGLRGISGSTGDMREILGKAETGTEPAQLALDVFVYRLVKYIGAYTAVLGGLDSLVFTATIGERSAPVRDLVCHKLEGLGVKIDEAKNDAASSADGTVITTNDSKVTAAVIRTDELAEMVRNLSEL